jgi:hypothetical protein
MSSGPPPPYGSSLPDDLRRAGLSPGRRRRRLKRQRRVAERIGPDWGTRVVLGGLALLAVLLVLGTVLVVLGR